VADAEVQSYSKVSDPSEYTAPRKLDKTARCKSPNRRWPLAQSRRGPACAGTTRGRSRPKEDCQAPLRIRRHPLRRCALRRDSNCYSQCQSWSAPNAMAKRPGPPSNQGRSYHMAPRRAGSAAARAGNRPGARAKSPARRRYGWMPSRPRCRVQSPRSGARRPGVCTRPVRHRSCVARGPNVGTFQSGLACPHGPATWPIRGSRRRIHYPDNLAAMRPGARAFTLSHRRCRVVIRRQSA
jgi:hypothetical protein